MVQGLYHINTCSGLPVCRTWGVCVVIMKRIHQFAIPLLLGLLVLLLFTYTAPPSVYTGDSGDMTIAASLWGYAHPPGYPLYSLLGNVWIRIFTFGTIAWRMNIFSALWGVGAVLMVYVLVAKLTKNSVSAVIAALTLAVSSTFWELSIVAEVFSLHTFLSLVFLYGGISFVIEQHKKYIYLSALAFALEIAHQHMIVLWMPGVLVLFIAKKFWRYLHMRDWLYLLLIMISGLSLYMYLYFSARYSGAYYWGDPYSLSGIVEIFFRKAYGTFRITARESGLSFTERLAYIPFYGLSALYNYSTVGIGIAFIGCIGFFRKYRLITSVIGMSFLLSGGMFLMYAGLAFGGLFTLGTLTKFSMMSLSLVAIFVGYGVHILQKKLPKNAIVLFFILPLYLLINHWGGLNMRGKWEGWYLGVDSLMFLPPGSVVRYVSDTGAFNPSYLQKVEGYRRDEVMHMSSPFEVSTAALAAFVPKYGVQTDLTGDALVAYLIDEHAETFSFNLNIAGHPPAGKITIPEWMARRLYTDKTLVPKEVSVDRVHHFLQNSLFLNNHDVQAPTTAYIKDIRRIYSDVVTNHGQYMALLGEYALSRDLLERGEALDPNNTFVDLGYAMLARLEGRCDDALRHLDDVWEGGSYLRKESLFERVLVYDTCLHDNEKVEQAKVILQRYREGIISNTSTAVE